MAKRIRVGDRIEAKLDANGRAVVPAGYMPYVFNGKTYLTKMKRGGTKGAKRKCGTKKAAKRSGTKKAAKRSGTKKAAKRSGTKKGGKRSGTKKSGKRSGAKKGSKKAIAKLDRDYAEALKYLEGKSVKGGSKRSAKRSGAKKAKGTRTPKERAADRRRSVAMKGKPFGSNRRRARVSESTRTRVG